MASALLSSKSSFCPRLVETAEEFIDIALLGDHMDDVVVLKDGLKKLGMENAMPKDILAGVAKSSTVREFLDTLSPDRLQHLKGRIYYSRQGKWELGKEKELKRSSKGEKLETLKSKKDELARNKEIRDDHMYLAEMRYIEKYRHHPSDEWAKTLLTKDVRDCVSPNEGEATVYWDRYDEGVFIGGHESGSPLHVDQVSWSNIGKNWSGYKVMALWKYGVSSFPILDKHLRQLFVNGSGAEQMAALKDVCKLVLVSPGDVFLFSGANAHTVMSIGDALSLTAYESFVNLNPRHTEVFLDTATENHFEDCWPDEEVLEDIKEEVAESLANMTFMAERGVKPLSPKTKHLASFEACRRLLCADKWVNKCFLETTGVSKRPCVCNNVGDQSSSADDCG